MPSKFEAFKQEIDDALALIDESGTLRQRKIESLPELNEVGDTKSLLDRCDRVADARSQEKPTIRIVHHLACSGGSLISKCIAAMPNVYLISEAHPHSDMHITEEKPFYSPSDLITLSRFAGIPNHRRLASEVFLKSLETICQHLAPIGAELILREHSHFDFFKGEMSTNNTVTQLLETNFELLQIVTLRNPIDSYLSLMNNNWITFYPQSFDEYCKRYLAFTNFYSDIEYIKYESILRDPEEYLKRICSVLRLEYSSLFTDIFEIFDVTGDSGRAGRSISERPRRETSATFTSEVKGSRYFKKIQKKFDYEGV